jgi:hypothetical protein
MFIFLFHVYFHRSMLHATATELWVLASFTVSLCEKDYTGRNMKHTATSVLHVRPHDMSFGRIEMRTYILDRTKIVDLRLHYILFYTRWRTARRDMVVVSNEQQVVMWCMGLFISHNYAGPCLESALLCVAVAVRRY